jgi:hypothetical protein
MAANLDLLVHRRPGPSDRWRVVHDGTVYTKGDELTVSDDVGQEWIQSGWVTEAKPAAPPPSRTTWAHSGTPARSNGLPRRRARWVIRRV